VGGAFHKTKSKTKKRNIYIYIYIYIFIIIIHKKKEKKYFGFFDFFKEHTKIETIFASGGV
jgi:hypothetical protein